jgi:hypothetical protein
VRFESVIANMDVPCSFLALDNDEHSLRVLKKSQPFWFHSIFVDTSSPSKGGASLLKEISFIEHLEHVPVVAYSSGNGYFSNSLHVQEEACCVLRLTRTDILPGVFDQLERGTAPASALTIPFESRQQHRLMEVA